MAQSLASRRALIVDDEFLIAFDLEASMRELGFEPVYAENLARAVSGAIH